MTQSETLASRTRTVCLAILTVIAVGFALYFLRPVLVPFLLALFLCQCLTPLIDLQVKYLRLPLKIAAVVTGLLGIALFVLVAAIAAASLTSLASDYHIYQQQFYLLAQRLSGVIPLSKFGFVGDTGGSGSGLLGLTGGSLGGFIGVGLTEVSSVVSLGILVAMFTVFMILGQSEQPVQRRALITQIELRVRRYILRTVLLSALTGVLIGIALALIGVRFAAVFGLFAFLLCFIPIAGPIIATLLPLPLVLLSSELSPVAKVLAILIPSLIQFIVGQAVTPKVMGKSLGLHPVTVLLFLIFFQMIWGIGGALMATPIAAIMKIVFQHFAATQPLARILEGDLPVLADRADDGPAV